MMWVVLLLSAVRMEEWAGRPKDATAGTWSLEMKKKREFQRLDRNGDGVLDPNELRTQLAGWSESDLSLFFQRYDPETKGVITFEQFMTTPEFQSS